MKVPPDSKPYYSERLRPEEAEARARKGLQRPEIRRARTRHRKRRAEGMPVLVRKFESAVAAHFSAKQTEAVKALFADRKKLEQTPVSEFMAALVKN